MGGAFYPARAPHSQVARGTTGDFVSAPDPSGNFPEGSRKPERNQFRRKRPMRAYGIFMVQMRMQFKRLIRPAIEVTIGLMIGGPLLGVAIIIAWMGPYPYRDARSNAEF